MATPDKLQPPSVAHPHFDRLLRLDPATETLYEAETGLHRAWHQRRIVWFGLILYNITLLPGYLLASDVFGTAMILKAVVITGMALMMAWSFVHLTARWRERITLVGMIAAHLVFVLLFWTTRAELGAYTFADQILTMVYGNMVLALRFRHAAAFTAIGLTVSLAAVLAKPGMPIALTVGLSTQILIAGLFSLAANYQMERRRCTDYVTALVARQRADRAEGSEQVFATMSRTDPLTGLPNRRHMDEVLATWCAGPHRLFVLMIDVDHFKPYNDSLGHPAGDDCLRDLARVFHTCAQDHDAFCARLGGEEFVMALRDATEDEARDLARSVADGVRRRGIPHPGRPDRLATVTVSIGLAEGGAGAATPSQVLAAADVALYQAKNAGRDRITVFGATELAASLSA